MSTVMKASEFVDKLQNIANNYKTLYVMGCFGAPMNATNKTRYYNHHSYNRGADRWKKIQAASADTFGFDCVCLIKGVLWGWSGNKNRTYGGAAYNSNGVPDIDADTMISKCSGVTTDFSKIEVGEAVWTRGHIGVYIGDGLAVECTPAWKGTVQITAVGNIGAKSGYNTRKWTKHGKLPYVEYEAKKVESKPSTPSKNVKVDVAMKRDVSLTGRYIVIPNALHIRTGAGTSKTSIGMLKAGDIVHNYGYYNVASNGAKWLYAVAPDGTIGYCSASWLKKCK